MVKGRGPQKLDDIQYSALGLVSRKYIERETALSEAQIRARRMIDEAMHEHDAELAAAVRSAADKGVPHSRIKKAVRVTDHRTYRSRYFEGYEKRRVDGWDLVDNEDGTITLSRFLRFATNIRFEAEGGRVVVIPKSGFEFDEQEFAEYRSVGKFEDEWALLMLDLRSKLIEED